MEKRQFLGSAALAVGALPLPAPPPCPVTERFGACPWALYHIEVQG